MPIGMRYVADAVVRAGHQVACLDLCFESPPQVSATITKRIRDYRPDVIGVSLRNLDVEDPDRIHRYNFAKYNLANYNLANYSLATYSEIGEPRPTNLDSFDATIRACHGATSVPLVLGGAAFTLLPRQFLARYPGSVGIVGPGEVSIVRLLSALETGADFHKTKGVVTQTSPDPAFQALELAPLPEIPDFQETAIPAYLVADGEYSIQSKRGCVFKCIHCSYPLIEGNQIRTHEPAEVARLVGKLSQGGVTRFRFVDSVFNNPVAHAVAMCESIVSLVPVPVSFTVNCSPVMFSKQLAVALKQAGCSKVIFGTDTASERMLTIMQKPFTKDHIRRATEVCKGVGLYFEHHMLLGAPGETVATATESLEFMDCLDCPVFVDLGIQVYENTGLAKMLNTRPVPNNDLVPPIFIEPEIADVLPNMIVEYCASRRNIHTFIAETEFREPNGDNDTLSPVQPLDKTTNVRSGTPALHG